MPLAPIVAVPSLAQLLKLVPAGGAPPCRFGHGTCLVNRRTESLTTCSRRLQEEGQFGVGIVELCEEKMP